MVEEEEEIRRNQGGGGGGKIYKDKKTMFSLVSLAALPFSVIFTVFLVF